MAGLVDACCRAGGQGGGDRRHHWSLLRRRMVAVRRTRRGLRRGSTRERERQRSMRGDARASRRGPVGRRRGGRELACGSVNLPQPAPARSPSHPPRPQICSCSPASHATLPSLCAVPSSLSTPNAGSSAACVNTASSSAARSPRIPAALAGRDPSGSASGGGAAPAPAAASAAATVTPSVRTVTRNIRAQPLEPSPRVASPPPAGPDAGPSSPSASSAAAAAASGAGGRAGRSGARSAAGTVRAAANLTSTRTMSRWLCGREEGRDVSG